MCKLKEEVEYNGVFYDPLDEQDYQALCGPDKIFSEEDHRRAVGEANEIRRKAELPLQTFYAEESLTLYSTNYPRGQFYAPSDKKALEMTEASHVYREGKEGEASFVILRQKSTSSGMYD